MASPRPRIRPAWADGPSLDGPTAGARDWRILPNSAGVLGPGRFFAATAPGRCRR